MKKLNYFATAFMAVLLCVGFASCNNDCDDPVDNNPVEKKMCTVSINPQSIISVEEEPLGRAAEAGNDLYLINVYQKNNGNTAPYAHGLFNDLNNITINLYEGETYYIQSVAVKDGKSLIHCNNEGLYGYPFKAKLTNDFVYDTENIYYFNPATFELAKDNGLKTSQITLGLENFLSNGNTYGYIASDDMEPIKLGYFRLGTVAAEFTAVDMPRGSLKITISAKDNKDETHTSSEIVLNQVDTPVSHIIGFGEDLLNKVMNNGQECNLNFTWVKDNVEETLMPVNFTFKNNTKYKIQIKVDYKTASGISVSPIFEGGFDENTETTNIVATPIPTANN